MFNSASNTHECTIIGLLYQLHVVYIRAAEAAVGKTEVFVQAGDSKFAYVYSFPHLSEQPQEHVI